MFLNHVESFLAYMHVRTCNTFAFATIQVNILQANYPSFGNSRVITVQELLDKVLEAHAFAQKAEVEEDPQKATVEEESQKAKVEEDSQRAKAEEGSEYSA